MFYKFKTNGEIIDETSVIFISIYHESRSVGVEPHEAKFFMKNTPKISCQLGP
ncbi:hypothetical protein D2M30_0584 [Bacillus amyloliquefaciens]|nr:hypothetical protein D2M30_0584 [Bacillus amyloliquefaciens]